MKNLYQISFYVPETHCDRVKQALFDAGAGRLENYQNCSWQTLGEGQFMPMPGSHAFLGETGSLEKVKEYKVEMLCKKDKLQDAIKALKSSHPYEVPAYSVIALEQIS